jgi:hypothetical protein
MDNLFDFEPVHKRICKIRVKLKYYNLTLISRHVPTEEKDEVVKEKFYSSLEKLCDAIPNYDMKTVGGDFNTKVAKESDLHPACEGHSLHSETNDNGKANGKFCPGKDLAVTGIQYQHKEVRMVTW